MSMAFTDIRDTAAWRASFLQTVPWVLEPAYAGLVGFCLQQIYPDLLHVWNLGISRDLIGCVLKIILTNESVFSGPNIAARLQTATDSLRSFARRNGFHLKMKRLTKKKIMWASKKYPEFRGSGSDSHVVAVWLESVLSAHSDQFPDLCTLLWSGNRMMKVLYNAGRFLDAQERETVRVLGRIFCQLYLNKASEAIQNSVFLWKVRPKMHLLVHICECRSGFLNASFYATWLDEDWLKQISRTMRLTSVKTTQVRVMERWLLSIPYNLKQVRLEHRRAPS